MGTKGEIGGCMEDGVIVLKKYLGNTEDKITVTHDGTRHCGGDGGLMQYFAAAMEDENYRIDRRVFEAHRLVFAAEESRVENL